MKGIYCMSILLCGARRVQEAGFVHLQFGGLFPLFQGGPNLLLSFALVELL